ncbi:VOC family protein [Streptomyces kanamyceticus]|uniref:Glyoxalase/bleomycin resistance/extradiol dioxygenase family protein n=1 Tax=Streptomyces kanamyceticus TaxID=1967 RepID=A0A5J6G7R4_STRKN|nr:VOC family protein [Streptomyces kanamyceticus]QEU89811.1 glyoxalase/bleomycin resistance/extradiol dioxygenase family protein [Streptomyces kanamyceticus]
MPVELNHTIVAAHDQYVSARFLADLLGLQVGPPDGPFTPVVVANGVTLDYYDRALDDSELGPEITPQHYAFQVTDEEFDAILARIRAGNLPYWADPHHRTPGEIRTRGRSRAAYFEDPNGHNMEILTPS